jgi:hypothetical protein
MSDLTYEQRVELLSDLYAGSDVPREYAWRAELGSYWASLADAYVYMVAKYTPADTMYDVLRGEDEMDERGKFTYGGADSMELLRHIVQLWQDRDALLAAHRNLLAPALPEAGWEAGLKHQLAQTLATQGFVMDDSDGMFGWKDYNLNFAGGKPNVIAVLSVWEDHWDEFEGTFTENSYHTGITGEVVLADGSVRLMRHESEIGDMLRSVLRGVVAK